MLGFSVGFSGWLHIKPPINLPLTAQQTYDLYINLHKIVTFISTLNLYIIRTQSAQLPAQLIHTIHTEAALADDLQIVTISDTGCPVTTSLAIAEGVNNPHKSVIQLIRQNISDLEEFGPLAFEMRVTTIIIGSFIGPVKLYN